MNYNSGRFQGNRNRALIAITLLLNCTFFYNSVSAQKKQQSKPPAPVSLGAGGKLVYAADSLGNRVPDFSYSGYMAGNLAIPDGTVRVVVPLKDGDATTRIQAALNYVASLPIDKNGLRGVVLLDKGIYHVNGSLRINASGVVLRGRGMGADGTILSGEGKTRETLITIAGTNNRTLKEAVAITDNYVPVNTTTISVANSSFKTGDNVIVRRPSTQNWIKLLGTETFGGGVSALGWKPGQRDIYWDRKVVSTSGNQITLDAPITTALDKEFDGGTVAAYDWDGRISQSGVEQLRLSSTYTEENPKDEAHRWMGITIEDAADCWVRQVVFEHFAGSAVALWETTKRITVEDCKSLNPVSEIGGQRRNTYWTTGQQTLFQRCYAENGYHDFAVGFCAAGPNAFVQCQSITPFSFSGAIDSWASGVLFDIVNVDGNALSYGNRGQDGQGAGWSAANSMFWQCTAALINCPKPPTAQNWSYASWAQFAGDGYWESSNEQIPPRSLYYAQLADRLGGDITSRKNLIPVGSEASSSPQYSEAARLTKASVDPAITLFQWIDEAPKRNPIPVEAGDARTIDQIGIKPPVQAAKKAITKITNGWVVAGNEVLTGKSYEVPWWRGDVKPDGVAEAKPAVTRFVPGRTGTGLTDDLSEVVGWMKNSNTVALQQHYGLWYERRRDDHERIRRMDGDVWPPFYELPFARSGQSSGWDGMSKYDLTKYNTWYWMRLKQFADLADANGLVLIHQNYFQHNIIEAGAHYVDFPWRTANNINNTGFPEPPPFAGDKRIFMAEQFYDTTYSLRTDLNRKYIRQCLANFKDNNAVIQETGEEFTGPLHFVQLWLNTVRDWQAETGKKEIIGLSTTKDVQDSVLADPKYSAVVDAIDIRYWHYQNDGTTYEPKGGLSLAPRQHARLLKPKRTSFDQVYRAVSEYRLHFPGKAVLYNSEGWDQFGWAVFMGGGSLAAIPKIEEQGFMAAAAKMKPIAGNAKDAGALLLGDDNHSYILYKEGGECSLPADLPAQISVYWIDARTGKTEKREKTSPAALKASLNEAGKKGAAVIWIRPA